MSALVALQTLNYFSLAQRDFLIAISSRVGNAQPQSSPNQRSAMSRVSAPAASYGTQRKIFNVSVSHTFDLVAKGHELISSSILQPFQCPQDIALNREI